jgi:hypothetical protein
MTVISVQASEQDRREDKQALRFDLANPADLLYQPLRPVALVQNQLDLPLDLCLPRIPGRLPPSLPDRSCPLGSPPVKKGVEYKTGHPRREAQGVEKKRSEAGGAH